MSEFPPRLIRRIGPRDSRIAAIALANQATLLSANLRTSGRFPASKSKIGSAIEPGIVFGSKEDCMQEHDRTLATAFDIQAAPFERAPVQSDPAVPAHLVRVADLPPGCLGVELKGPR